MTRKRRQKTGKSLKHDMRKGGWDESLYEFQKKKGWNRQRNKIKGDRLWKNDWERF